MTIISAELGINHGGSLETALEMVETAVLCGAGAIKVQAYRCEDFLPKGHPDWQMFKDCELSWDAIFHIAQATNGFGLAFGATPTSLDGIARLADLNVDFLKNGSDFLLRTDMIDAMGATGIKTWVGVGMATDEEVETLPHKVKVMACTSAYPCPDDEANLNRLVSLDGEDAPRSANGYSDHTEGIVAGIAAAALGAEMVEKHFTLDKGYPGPDHYFSADPEELAALCAAVRRVEKMRGHGYFDPTPSELPNRDRWRVSLDKPVRS